MVTCYHGLPDIVAGHRFPSALEHIQTMLCQDDPDWPGEMIPPLRVAWTVLCDDEKLVDKDFLEYLISYGIQCMSLGPVWFDMSRTLRGLVGFIKLLEIALRYKWQGEVFRLSSIWPRLSTSELQVLLQERYFAQTHFDLIQFFAVRAPPSCQCLKGIVEKCSSDSFTVCQNRSCSKYLPRQKAWTCNACGIATYCGYGCQLQDWSSYHKPICRLLQPTEVALGLEGSIKPVSYTHLTLPTKA